MSATARIVRPADAGMPAWGWWLALAGTLAAYLVGGPIPALALVALCALQAWEPLGFWPAYMLMVGGAAFINYTRGTLTAELSLLTIAIVYVLFCYVLAARDRSVAFPLGPVMPALAAYAGLTFLNLARGILVGNSMRYAGLEILALLALLAGLLVANLDFERRWRFCLGALVVIGLACAAVGITFFGMVMRRVGSIFFTPVPGVVSLMVMNFMVREEDRRRRWLWTMVWIALLLHQFLSFTRGYWFGLVGAWAFTAALYGGLGRGSGARWKRMAWAFALLIGLGVTGVEGMSRVLGIPGLLELAGERLGTSAGTELTYETASNVVRLVEYGKVITEILDAPWLGHGLGYHFVVREPLHQRLQEQWFTHQNYLLVWLKQGALGLAIFVWLLATVVMTAWREARRRTGWEQAWLAGTGAATVYCSIHSMVYFTYAEVNTAFPLGLLWGGLIAITSTGHWRLAWRRRDGGAES